jgi:hypothetical protein
MSSPFWMILLIFCLCEDALGEFPRRWKGLGKHASSIISILSRGALMEAFRD